MKKSCENLNCYERGFKEVLIRDKKNKEYKILCKQHYEQYIKNQDLNCSWASCNRLGEFKAPAKDQKKYVKMLIIKDTEI